MVLNLVVEVCHEPGHKRVSYGNIRSVASGILNPVKVLIRLGNRQVSVAEAKVGEDVGSAEEVVEQVAGPGLSPS